MKTIHVVALWELEKNIRSCNKKWRASWWGWSAGADERKQEMAVCVLREDRGDDDRHVRDEICKDTLKRILSTKRPDSPYITLEVELVFKEKFTHTRFYYLCGFASTYPKLKPNHY